MARKGKKKASTSNRTLKENEVAQDALVETKNSDSMIAKIEQIKGVAHRENTETTSVDMTKNVEDEETKHEEQNVIIQKSEEILEDDEDIQELNGHNMIEEDQKSITTPEDDEDNQDGPMEEDDEDNQDGPMEEDDEDNQEDSMEEYDEEDTSDEENESFEDEDSEEDATNTFEDEDSEEDATEEEGETNGAKEEKEIAKGDSGKAEKCNEENMGALSKEKAKKSGERSGKKVKENSVDNDDDGEEDRMKEEDDNGAKVDKENADGDGQNAEERSNVEKLETRSKEKVKKSWQMHRKKKVEDRSFKKVASGAEDKPESSTKKKSKKRSECMGMIFMCSSQTKNDCYRYRVLGLPASKKDLVKKIYEGMRLFLYDIDLKLMYGIYKAAGAGGYNIEPKAFKLQFPSQVRFTVLEDCLPLAEEKFKMVIKNNYFTRNKFDCQLTSTQVKELCKLFVPARKVSHAKNVGRGKAENPTPARRERKRRRRGDDETPKRQERNRRRRGDVERRTSLREERWHHEHPRKRRRDAVTSHVAPLYQPPPLSAPAPAPAPAPQPLIVPSYAYGSRPEVSVYRLDPYLDDRDRYRGGRDPYFDRRDPYREGRDPYIEHRDSSRDGRGLAPQDTYRREPRREHTDVYRPDRLVEYHDSYRRDELLEYRDRRSSNLGTRRLDEISSRDPYVSYQDRTSNLEARQRDEIVSRDPYVSYRDRTSNLETSRRDEIVSRDPYVSYQDRTSNLETRRRDEIVSRDPYVSYQDSPSYADSLYSTERLSRTGLVPEYRLAGPVTDHLSSRNPLPVYRSRGTLSRY